MRKSILALIKVCSVIALVGVGSTSSHMVQKAQAASCKGGQGIGVHRTVNLNTKGGKRYGKSHGGAKDFLRQKEVVLTFDDGPVPNITPKILHELDRHCAKATFFMVATMAKNYPTIAKKIARKGHSIGIHSYNHKNLGHISGKKAILDVNRSIATIEKAVGRDVAPFFRFPYLSENKSVNNHLNRLDYGVFAIDVDSLDYKFSKPTSMVNRVMSELKRKGKGIILLHDIQKVTAKGLGQLLDRLDEEGYKIVHIKGRGGKDPQEPILVSSASDKKVKSKPMVVAARSTAKTTASWTIRTSLDVSDHKNPIRAKVKKRIFIGSSKPTKKSKPEKVASITAQDVFERNKKKALKQFTKNKQAFRAAIKMRIIN